MRRGCGRCCARRCGGYFDGLAVGWDAADSRGLGRAPDRPRGGDRRDRCQPRADPRHRHRHRRGRAVPRPRVPDGEDSRRRRLRGDDPRGEGEGRPRPRGPDRVQGRRRRCAPVRRRVVRPRHPGERAAVLHRDRPRPAPRGPRRDRRQHGRRDAVLHAGGGARAWPEAARGRAARPRARPAPGRTSSGESARTPADVRPDPRADRQPVGGRRAGGEAPARDRGRADRVGYPPRDGDDDKRRPRHHDRLRGDRRGPAADRRQRRRPDRTGRRRARRRRRPARGDPRRARQRLRPDRRHPDRGRRRGCGDRRREDPQDRCRRGQRRPLPLHRELRIRLRREPDRQRGAPGQGRTGLCLRSPPCARRLEAGDVHADARWRAAPGARVLGRRGQQQGLRRRDADRPRRRARRRHDRRRHDR